MAVFGVLYIKKILVFVTLSVTVVKIVGDIDGLSIAGRTPDGPFHIEYQDRTHEQTFLATTLNGSYVRLRRPNAICDISNCTKLDNLYAGP